MTIYEEREAQKARWKRYREAAAKLFPNVSFRHQVACSETAEKNGAFIEGTVWVPREAIEPADARYTSACTEEGFDEWWDEFGKTFDESTRSPYYVAMAAWAASRARVKPNV